MEAWGPELAVILGVVEGLTEFLPVSSTGHLILVSHYLGFTGELAISVEISIQLGAVLAIVAYERTKLTSLFTGALREQAALRDWLRDPGPRGSRPLRAHWTATFRRSVETHRNLWFLVGLLVAFCPAAVVGLFLHHWIMTHLFSPHTVAGALIAGGLIILLVEARPPRTSVADLNQVGMLTAFLVGVAQCCALFPGVSRAGSTIIGGMLAGMNRRVATEFSFFLALPTMIAATTYHMVTSRSLFDTGEALALILGLVVAFLVAWAVIAALLEFVKRYSLRVFGVYRILLGLVVLWAFT
ncbi:MAG: undecaprenyl-diphosphate phosphatase [Nitrospirales bacterium]